MDYPNTPAARRARRRRRERSLDALPSRPAATSAFVVRSATGTYDQIETVREAVADVPYSSAEQRKAERLLTHILVSADREDDGFVPVPAKLIEREFRGLDWRLLEEMGLLRSRPYSREAGQCRTFGAADPLRRAFYEAGPTAERVVQDGFYDLMTGRPTTRRVKSERRTPSGNALPPLVRAAIDATGEVPVDVHAVELHLDTLRAAADEAPEGPSRVSAQARYLNDLRCHHAVLTQGARPLDPERPDGLWVYRPAYRAQRFGRVSQIGGGLQSCSKRMKSLAYPPLFPPSLW